MVFPTMGADPSYPLSMTLNVPLTTPADPSRSLRITPFIPCHYDAFRSPLLVTCFPKIVILSGDKNMPCKKAGKRDSDTE